jgi:hypothetical protein
VGAAAIALLPRARDTTPQAASERIRQRQELAADQRG